MKLIMYIYIGDKKGEQKLMGLMEELKEKGVNIDEGVNRLMGNAGLYQKMLFKLVDLIRKSPVDLNFDANDYEKTIEEAHAIKGATGNLSVTPLYEAYTKAVNLLREGKPEEARTVLTDILPVQEDILSCIEKYA